MKIKCNTHAEKKAHRQRIIIIIIVVIFHFAVMENII